MRSKCGHDVTPLQEGIFSIIESVVWSRVGK